jgi:hypothetical protein
MRTTEAADRSSSQSALAICEAKGLVPEQVCSLAPARVGKTWNALQLLCHLARGLAARDTLH